MLNTVFFSVSYKFCQKIIFLQIKKLNMKMSLIYKPFIHNILRKNQICIILLTAFWTFQPSQNFNLSLRKEAKRKKTYTMIEVKNGCNSSFQQAKYPMISYFCLVKISMYLNLYQKFANFRTFFSMIPYTLVGHRYYTSSRVQRLLMTLSTPL